MNDRYIKRIARGILFTYLLILIYWMFLGFSRSQSEFYSYNLVPFSTLKNYFFYFSHYPFMIWAINIIGNVAVFAPFGLLIPIAYKKFMHLGSFLTLFILGITTLELLQFVTRMGSLDVDDIILNTVGALIGFIVIKVFLRFRAY